MRFENQTVVIACSGSDAGIACAKRYLDEGAQVVLYYNEPERLAHLEDYQNKYSQTLHTIKISDFRSFDELREAGEKVVKELGTVDIVVTAITTTSSQTTETMTEEEYQRILHTIASGALWTIQPLIPAMIEKKYGRIAIISSVAGRTGIPGVTPAFAAANAALGGIGRNIGCTMGVNYITANTIAVGPLEDGSYAIPSSRKVEGIMPDRRLGRLEDVAGAVEYLTSPLASWTTGETLDLSGGFFMV